MNLDGILDWTETTHIPPQVYIRVLAFIEAQLKALPPKQISIETVSINQRQALRIKVLPPLPGGIRSVVHRS